MSHNNQYKSRPLTQKLRAQILAMRQKGARIDTICGRLKVNRVVVREVILSEGLPFKNSWKAIPITPEVVAEAVREYNAGKSFHYVARKILHKRNPDAVVIMERAGVTLRPFRGNGKGEWRNKEKPPFTSSEVAICQAVMLNGVSVRTAVKLYGRGSVTLEEVERLVERYRKEVGR